MTNKARRVMRELFEALLADVDLMPESISRRRGGWRPTTGRAGARAPSPTTSPA